MDSVLHVTPYYNKPCKRAYIIISEPLPIARIYPSYLYNIPGRTAVNMTPETVKKYSQINNIVALKESASSIEPSKLVRSACAIDFHIYCGDDALTLDFMKEGASGVIRENYPTSLEKQIHDMIHEFNSHNITAMSSSVY